MWCHIIALPLFFCPNRKIKMRLIEIKISVYEKDVADIVGNDNHKLDELRSCCIDLDRVESFWEDPVKEGGDGILIKFYSGDSYWTKSFTLDQFRNVLQKERFEQIHFSDLIDQSKFHAVRHG